MGRRQSRIQPSVTIDPLRFGVSFSLKQCRDFNIFAADTLKFLIEDVGFRRFRLMSYWNEHEKNKGTYDFTALDAQVRMIEKAGGSITLCLGVRQPRWPESHWPTWALELDQSSQYRALYLFITAVVERYKDRSVISSYQLENEALNRGFGTHGNFDRKRLRDELQLVRTVDPKKPIIMSTSNTWGLPFRRPRPDVFGFTFYQIQHDSTGYSHSKLPWWWYNIRRFLIYMFTLRPSFIHELQAEPWGPKAIWEMTAEEQDASMSVAQLKKNLALAKKTELHPIDLWGGEWWYWRKQQGDDAIWKTVREALVVRSS